MYIIICCNTYTFWLQLLLTPVIAPRQSQVPSRLESNASLGLRSLSFGETFFWFKSKLEILLRCQWCLWNSVWTNNSKPKQSNLKRISPSTQKGGHNAQRRWDNGLLHHGFQPKCWSVGDAEAEPQNWGFDDRGRKLFVSDHLGKIHVEGLRSIQIPYLGCFFSSWDWAKTEKKIKQKSNNTDLCKNKQQPSNGGRRIPQMFRCRGLSLLHRMFG